MLGLKPEELDFMLSAEGQAAIAHAKREHRLHESWKGPQAMPWTEGHAAMAVRASYIAHQRASFVAAEFEAGAAHRNGEETALRALRSAALAVREKGMGNEAA